MPGAKVYIYVVDRDFGFAPNPFHGSCTLATCKPGIRKGAVVGDWVIGMGGGRLNATGRCVFAMQVTEKLSFNEYWSHPAYLDKKPVRNGSRRMMVGDNIYYYDPRQKRWDQADSHHSNGDGSINKHNLLTDTKTDRVLISRHFYYFGASAPIVPANLLAAIGYTNRRHYRVFTTTQCERLLDWLHTNFKKELSTLQGDPFDFENSEKRYSAGNNKIY